MRQNGLSLNTQQPKQTPETLPEPYSAVSISYFWFSCVERVSSRGSEGLIKF
jgi:hypothetical protein